MGCNGGLSLTLKEKRPRSACGGSLMGDVSGTIRKTALGISLAKM